jgi:hypothetical protein
MVWLRACCVAFIFLLEDEAKTILTIVRNHLPNDTAIHPTRLESSTTRQWEPQIAQPEDLSEVPKQMDSSDWTKDYVTSEIPASGDGTNHSRLHKNKVRERPMTKNDWNSQTGQDSVVGIATRYGLDGPGIESQWGWDFPHPSRPALGPTHPLIQWAPGLFPGGIVAGAWSWPLTII